MNLANKLTMIRIFLVPIFLIFIAVKNIPYGTFIATFIFIIASLTDQLDGYIARSRNQVTNFGKFMDPLADKLLVTAALISLVELQVIPAWATVVIIAREFAVSGLRTIAAAEGKVIAASNWGKLKTVTQIIAIIFLLIQVNVASSKYLISLVSESDIFKNVITYGPKIALFLAVLMTIISGYDYFAKNMKIIDTNK
ncbi:MULTISPECIES: CDP-diacylglycerol--glycerol-3-phosphate 3-phosphatidyltransferase [Clostridium]|jgi:CDP-diacylglycerol---glycerol-3-phosphate 3-phosphatidyltransferase|uniref:CDP-diacylglycerol--glycerol-3-phosphate 3-phosphatidyltransferase n=2 Tax=root TaxID=1 RepID=R9CJY2_9CLOT|nr:MULTISPECIES: CDP-diacylglycerol--glycerol-3-phosphate 3-phosphatidyltransferase [Clostridium]EOR27476.1 CDP-diacylglycerol--glycerol-3-phosphate 3-phosphatidyltransferase [Clostridium sartagoforme AAU1]KLE16480.1 CDP-diacylglycerol--glycerol-3-phosphate 3-phosphatidyltransferase [Clostridium sp. C8]